MGKQQDKTREIEMFNGVAIDGYSTHNTDEYEEFFKYFSESVPVGMTGEHHVLEIGCGTGAFGRFFLEKLKGKAAWSVTGVDITPRMIEWIQNNAVEGYRGKQGDLEEEALFDAESFDVVLSPMVLHHFPDPLKVISNMSRWLKKSGVIYIMEPNGSSPVNQLSKFIRHCVEKVMGLEYAKQFATVNETDHSLKRYQHCLQANDCEILCYRTIGPWRFWDTSSFVNCVRAFLYWVAQVLGDPYNGSALIIVARKKG
jgi:SAM-dependent methyltransferase